MTSKGIADELRARIASGQLKPGGRVPSARQIMRKYGVANATASKALSILIEEGLLRAIPGVGTVVEQGLSEARIVSAALAIADREGLAAVSIRRVASELRVAPMSLYRYFPSKDELVLLLADAAFAESKPPSHTEGELRSQLEAALRVQWQAYSRHPWLAGAISITRPQLLPHGMLHTEHVLRLLDGTGLSDNVMMQLSLTLMAYVRGVAVNIESELQAEHDSQLSVDAYLTRQTEQFQELTSAQRMPTLARIGSNPEIEVHLDGLFEFGLARLLDGIVAFVQRERSPRTRHT